jgi:hypothetical protein
MGLPSAIAVVSYARDVAAKSRAALNRELGEIAEFSGPRARGMAVTSSRGGATSFYIFFWDAHPVICGSFLVRDHPGPGDSVLYCGVARYQTQRYSQRRNKSQWQQSPPSLARRV